jgi:hypothetical protein
LIANGEFSVVRLSTGDWFLYTTGQASYGALAAEASPRSSSQLLRAEERDGSGHFTFDFAKTASVPRAGATLLMEHGDGVTHGYTIVRAKRAGDRLEVWTQEPPGFRASAQNAEVRFDSFPGTTHPGPTRAIWQLPASASGRP